MSDLAMTPVWINGLPQSRLPANDRGLSYGDGIFETIKVSSGLLTLSDLHWRRLEVSCRQLSIPVDINLIKTETADFLSDLSPDSQVNNGMLKTGVLKIIVTRGSGGRGYSPAGCTEPTRVLSIHPLPVRVTDPATAGARVMRCKLPLGQSAFAGMKHLNRLEQVMARAEWQNGQWDEGLLCDFDGNLIEGTMSNLFLVTHDGRLLTPDLHRCGVAGVCREFIIDKAKKLGLVVEISTIKSGLLDIAEMFLCNSVNGVWPVVQCAEQRWGIGPVTTKIRDCLLEELNA